MSINLIYILFYYVMLYFVISIVFINQFASVRNVLINISVFQVTVFFSQFDHVIEGD